jgi:sterol desaturase/sphingolipid hydroxylase (fatty acid hydroxylase superfamily)
LIVAAWLLGLDLPATLAAYVLILFLQLTDHTNVTFNIGWLRYVFMDNHAHRLHHCDGGELVNFAAAFSFWDRWFGTYHEDWSVSSAALHLHHLPIPATDRLSSSR